MSKKQIHWFEAKQLDRVTNFSTEIEVVKAAIEQNVQMNYYCTFKKEKVYFGLENNICYLGRFKNRYIKAVEFQLSVVWKSIRLVLSGSDNVIIVNQDLVKHVLPARRINRLLGKNNKFVIDIRTTPTDPENFEEDMKTFHRSFRKAVRYFDGLSFITPFMEKYIMKEYRKNLPTVHWSSGVDTELFNPELYSEGKPNEHFTIFYHGGISESRGNLDLIKACELLVKRGYKIQLVQIGICVDTSIPKYVEQTGIEEWCKLLPPVPLKEIPRLVSNADLPVMPFPNFMAWRVSSPIKLMEYLAMGKKVLAPNIEAFTDVFHENPQLVFYFEAGKADQAEAIAGQIAAIIDNDLLKDINRKECVDFVTQRYTWKIQANKLIDFCLKL
jgi:glycosyltransferase involved in cell wall biosynthesis